MPFAFREIKMSTFVIEERELLGILTRNGLAEKKAAKLLRETREISPATGAEMLVPFGVPYERAFQFLNSAPLLTERSSPVKVRRVAGLLFVILTALNIAAFTLGKRDTGAAIRSVVFGSLAWYFLRNRENQ